MSADDDNIDLPRRRFLAGLALCPLLPACEFAEVFDAEGGKRAVFNLEDPEFQPLQEVDGMACAAAGAIEILLIRTSDQPDEPNIRAFSRYCPHENQDMAPCDESNVYEANWDPEAEELTCTLHNSVFDIDGEAVSGPAEMEGSDLQTFDVEFDPDSGDGTVIIQGGSGDAGIGPDAGSDAAQ